MERPYFPMFVDISGKKILVLGGGQIALRRIRTLLKFRADIRVIAPELCSGLKQLEEEGKIRVEHREYMEGDIPEEDSQTDPFRKGNGQRTDIVFAATDCREVNYRIWKECRKAGILVNVADDRKLCDFYFPSVVMTEKVVIGINSGGSDPGTVKRTREQIEKIFLLGEEGTENT